MRANRSIALSIAFMVVFFVGVSMEESLTVARTHLQAAVSALTAASFTAPAWAR